MNKKTENNLLGKIIIVIWIILFMLNVFVAVMASQSDLTRVDHNTYNKGEIGTHKYLELKATEVKEIGER